MLLRRMLISSLAAVALLAGGCTGDEPEEKPTGPLPAPQGLIDDAAEVAEEITSTHFVVAVDGTVPGMSVTSIDGDLSAEGESVAAKGTAKIPMSGSAEVKFVLVDGTLHLDQGGGTYQQIPEATAKMIYDFSAVLDPERGVAKLISSIEDAKTEAGENLAGTPVFKITGTVPMDAIVGLVPRAKSDVPVTLWVTENGHEPVKAAAKFSEGDKTGTMSVTLSQVNEPVTVEPPA